MNISCKIIRDLLPLYHDDVCSGESRSLVEEHLKTCEGCAEELRRIGEEMNAAHITPENEIARKAISSAWKKAKKKSFAKGIILAALLCAFLSAASSADTMKQFPIG
jgi:predicted anti-sigma-YlaC factor YlaD